MKLLLPVLLLCLLTARAGAQGRQTIDLDGEWEIGQGAMDVPPEHYDAKVPVPGLVDLAQPAFTEVGEVSKQRQAFWYRRVFHIDGDVPAVATVRVAKAFYGTRVYLNGVSFGDHWPIFTPGYFDVTRCLKGQGADNVLVIRVGADRGELPVAIPDGYDQEKAKYIPGIYDSVQLILSGTPNLVRVQAAPDIWQNKVHVQALLHNGGDESSGPVTFTVSESRSKTPVGTVTVSAPIPAGSDKTLDVDIPVEHAHLWSPEDPFLYTLDVKTTADQMVTRFGMREFRFDPTSGRAILNGKTYFMRGSNTTVLRFFEDPERSNLPWDHAWVQRLYDGFKQFHWNSLRYSIGFPPEFWYDIADEEGYLIQDEFPIWNLKLGVPTEELVHEYKEYMQEHWNHASVVIWDAQNETRDTPQTLNALQQVRHLDLSNRPWDNGWGGVPGETDIYEAHPYHLKGKKPLQGLATALKIPDYAVPNLSDHNLSPYRVAILINEYGGIWINRQGYPTFSSKKFYDNVLGPNATPEQYRETFAHYMAADTEFWRGNRGCAGVLEFTSLSYSRPGGVTCDHFIDLKNLVYEPHLATAYKSAFAPIGLMLDCWETEVPAGSTYAVPVVVINDLEPEWQGTVTLTLRQGGKEVLTTSQPVTVKSFGDQRVTFAVKVPAEAGDYDLQASIVGSDGQPVISERAFPVQAP